MPVNGLMPGLMEVGKIKIGIKGKKSKKNVNQFNPHLKDKFIFYTDDEKINDYKKQRSLKQLRKRR